MQQACAATLCCVYMLGPLHPAQVAIQTLRTGQSGQLTAASEGQRARTDLMAQMMVAQDVPIRLGVMEHNLANKPNKHWQACAGLQLCSQGEGWAASQGLG